MKTLPNEDPAPAIFHPWTLLEQVHGLSHASVGTQDLLEPFQGHTHQRVVKVKFPLSFGFESVGIRYLRTKSSGL